MNKTYRLIKLFIFVVAGILIFVFNKQLMSSSGAILNGLVGTVMFYYGIEGILIPVFTKKVKKEALRVLNGSINILFAVIMIFVLEGNTEELRIVCVLWAVWSIMREGQEIVEKVFNRIKRHPVTSIINLLESLTIIFFSIEMIIAKTPHELEHHAHVHLILLGVELIIEVLWEYFDELEERYIKKRNRVKHDA